VSGYLRTIAERNTVSGRVMRDLLYLSCMGVTADSEKLFIVPDAVATSDTIAALDRLTKNGPYDWKLASEAQP